MQVIIEGATVARYGTYGRGEALKYERGPHAGKVIEFVDVLTTNDYGESESRTLTLSPSINGSRPPVGAEVSVLCRVAPKQEVWFRRDGREQILTRDKWRAENFAPSAPAAKAA